MSKYKTTAYSTYLKENGSSDLCKELKITREALHYWKSNGIPANRIPDLSRLTGINETVLAWDSYLIKKDNNFRRA